MGRPATVWRRNTQGPKASSSETGAVAGARKPQLARLTSLRAFAAMSVFVFHISRADWIGTSRLASGGYVAVSFFFVLSGFILVWSTPASLGQTSFYRRRFARIYPAHLVMLLVALVVPVVASGNGLLSVLMGVLLLQAWATGAGVVFGCNDVSWSLSCEAFFYALFPVVVRLMRRLPHRTLMLSVTGLYGVAAVAVITGTVASQALRDPSLNNLVYTDPLIRLPEFLLGMAAGVAFADGWRPRVSLPAAVALLLLLYVPLSLFQVPGPLLDAVTPLVFVAIVVAAASDDVSGASSWLAHPWLVYAGELSFCFYLVHELVIINVRHVLPQGIGALVALIVAIAAAVALHHLVERPAQRWLRSLGKRPGSRRQGRVPAAVHEAGVS